MIIQLYLYMLATALITSIACALVGSLLLVRGMSFISDALGHAILLGIVISFLIVHNIHSLWIFFGATLLGLCMIFCTEWLIQNKKLAHDSAIGCMFPIFFAIAVILINMYTQNIHLDLDAIFLGELALVPFQTITVHNINIGPYAFWMMLIITIINASTILRLLNIFALTIFDAQYASSIKINPAYFHYILMALTCMTMIGAFECAGSIIVVSCMVSVPASAYLLCNQLKPMIVIATLYAMIGTVSGCIFAHWFNVCIAGSIAFCNFLIFCITLAYHRWQNLSIKNLQLPI